MTTDHWLASGDWFSVASTVKSGTWAELAKLAWPKLNRYHGDLYHDAALVDTYLDALDGTNEVTFFYGVGDSGTQLSFDRRLAEHRAGPEGDVYVLTVRSERRERSGTWRLYVTHDTTWRELSA
jgi:hypothetical protein